MAREMHDAQVPVVALRSLKFYGILVFVFIGNDFIFISLFSLSLWIGLRRLASAGEQASDEAKRESLAHLAPVAAALKHWQFLDIHGIHDHPRSTIHGSMLCCLRLQVLNDLNVEDLLELVRQM